MNGDQTDHGTLSSTLIQTTNAPPPPLISSSITAHPLLLSPGHALTSVSPNPGRGGGREVRWRGGGGVSTNHNSQLSHRRCCIVR